MGEAKRRLSTTQKFTKEFPSCFFCGGQRQSETREHMPPKALFDNSHRPDKLVMPACSICNRETSTADLTAAIISRWDYFAASASNDDHRRLVVQVRRQAPQLVEEWVTLSRKSSVQRKRARQHLRNHGVPVPLDAGVATIGPLTISQLNLFAYKVVLALHFEIFRKPLPITGRVSACWKTKEDFAAGGVPEELLGLLPRYGTLMQGRWNEWETFEYRYDMNINEGLFGCLARFRRGLFVAGFTIADANTRLENEDATWMNPADPSDLLRAPRFQRKL